MQLIGPVCRRGASRRAPDAAQRPWDAQESLVRKHSGGGRLPPPRPAEAAGRPRRRGAPYGLLAVLFTVGSVHAAAAVAQPRDPRTPPSVPEISGADAPTAPDHASHTSGAGAVAAAIETAPRDNQSFDLSTLHTAGGLTGDQAAARAIETAPSIRSEQAAARAATAQATEVAQRFFPRLEAIASYRRLSEVPQPFGAPISESQVMILNGTISLIEDDFSRSLWELFLPGLLSSRVEQILDHYLVRLSVTYPVSDLFLSVMPAYEALDGAARAREMGAEAARATVALRAREAYYGYARARGAEIVAESAVTQTEAHRAQVQSMVDAGVTARVDLLRVEAQLAAARVQAARATGAVDLAREALATIMHQELEGVVGIGEDLSSLPPDTTEAPSALVQRALANRAELRAMRRVIEAREDDVAARNGGLYPHFALTGNFDYGNPNPRIFPQLRQWDTSWDVGAVLSWSPNDMTAATSQAGAARAGLAQAQADLEVAEDGIRLEVAQARTDYVAARSSHEAASAGLVAAEESYRVRSEQLRAGTTVISDLIDAEAELTRARLDLLNTIIDVRIAQARLHRAVGDAG